MRILPVIDLKGGLVVRGIAGRRKKYRPIRSSLTTGSEPVALARAFRSHFGLEELYVADLDAIAGGEPSWGIYAALHREGFRLWLDAGIRSLVGASALAEAGVASMVIGLETLAGPGELAAMVAHFGRRIVFSLDLHNGRPLGNLQGWEGQDPWSLAEQAVQLGVRRVLVLDLARVGVNQGTGTEELCSRLRRAYPEVEVTAGGGVRHRGDLERLQSCGIDNVLVASALHDGRLTAEDCRSVGR